MEWVEGIDLGALHQGVPRRGRSTCRGRSPSRSASARCAGSAPRTTRVAPDGTPAPVIHRDVSPHNVLLGVNGVVKLTDFGLARARDRVASLTAPGTVKGKLSYLAPEVAFGKPNTVQSDLFGVGNVLWETLTGERLFDGKTDVEIFKKIRACKIPPIAERRPDVPAALLAVLDVALAADPDEPLRQRRRVRARARPGDEASGRHQRGHRARHRGREARERLKANEAIAELAKSGVAASTEIEFSKTDVAVEPAPLTPKFEADSSAATTLPLKPAPPVLPATPPVKKK